jgi:hypothetical protein
VDSVFCAAIALIVHVMTMLVIQQTRCLYLLRYWCRSCGVEERLIVVMGMATEGSSYTNSTCKSCVHRYIAVAAPTVATALLFGHGLQSYRAKQQVSWWREPHLNASIATMSFPRVIIGLSKTRTDWDLSNRLRAKVTLLWCYVVLNCEPTGRAGLTRSQSSICLCDVNGPTLYALESFSNKFSFRP